MFVEGFKDFIRFSEFFSIQVKFCLFVIFLAEKGSICVSKMQSSDPDLNEFYPDPQHRFHSSYRIMHF